MNDTRATLPERAAYLWMLGYAPAIWMFHFLLSYVTAAVWCGMVAGASGTLDGAHTAVAVYTIVALIGIALVGWSGHKRHRHGTEVREHDSDSPEARHRFLGFATLLLAGLSAVATIYVAMAAMFFQTCH